MATGEAGRILADSLAAALEMGQAGRPLFVALIATQNAVTVDQALLDADLEPPDEARWQPGDPQW